jgi:hypothetical protein
VTVAIATNSVGSPSARTGGHVSLVRVEIIIDGVRVIDRVSDRWDAQLKLSHTCCLFLERMMGGEFHGCFNAFMILRVQPSAAAILMNESRWLTS